MYGEDLNITELFTQKISALIEEESNLNEAFVNCSITNDNLKAKYSAITGEKEKELTNVLDSIKVVRQAYHGNVFIGNHCVIILKLYEELTTVVKEQSMYPQINELFDIFSKSMILMMKRRFLNESEISDLRNLCHAFDALFPVYFPWRSITRKIHEFIFNVPTFVEKHKTIGMLSEQDGKSKHASVNAELKALAGVRNQAEKIRLVLEREELRSTAPKELIKPVARICKYCSRRTFLRAGIDKQKHCPSCE